MTIARKPVVSLIRVAGAQLGKEATRNAYPQLEAEATATALVKSGNQAQQISRPPYTVKRLDVTPNPKRATPFVLHAACSHIHETYHSYQALIEGTVPNDDLQKIP